MILGIGTDIVRTARFAEILARNPKRLGRLCERILHPQEAAQVTNENVVQTLASAWAAKEALYKSLGVGEQKQCIFNQWKKQWVGGKMEMVSDLPRSDTCSVSLSHDAGLTTAFVVRQAAPKKENFVNETGKTND